MNILEPYGIKTCYKGTVLEILNDGKVMLHIPDLLLSKPNIDLLSESLSSNNIINASDLSLEGSIKSINSIICRPLYINGILFTPNIGDTVFVFMFEADPKKLFYINISPDKPKV